MSSGDPRRKTEPSGRLSAVLDYLGRNFATVGLLSLGVGLILLILITLSGFGGTAKTGAAGPAGADPLDDVRASLDHDADVGACRAALQQINVALGGKPEGERPPGLDPKRRERLKQDLGLGEDDLSEVGADAYTTLDGWCVAGALLFRDAATRALEPEEAAGDPAKGAPAPPQPLDRAKAAFAWAVREVRLARPTAANLVPPADPEGKPGFVATPPQFVVRRGSGTPLERSLVFLDLLDQLNAATPHEAEAGEGETGPPALAGCLVFCKGHEAPDDPWACGVLLDGKPDVYLFDPRLGMPLPGEGGQGVATLADVCRKPELLAQLKIDGAPAYDVTAEEARTAEFQVVCPLSALAPRMAHLQTKVLPPVRVALHHDLDADLALWRGAADKAGDVKPAVKVWSEGVTLLRRFLPAEEGGADPGWPHGFELRTLVGFTDPKDDFKVQMPRYLLFQLELAPWDVMPPQFRDLTKFPYGVGLGQRVRDNYKGPFVRIALEAQGPRDRLLRGDFDDAATDLVGFSARMEQERLNRVDAGTDGKLEQQVDDWVEKARHAYAEQVRAHNKEEDAQKKGTPDEQRTAAAERQAADKAVDDVWKESGPVRILLEGASCVPGAAEVTYQLGLCKQEKAEQEQARADRMRRDGRKTAPSQEADLRTAWMDALGWWKKYGDDHPPESADRPSTCPGRAAAVRRLRARAQEMLGDRKAAAATCEDDAEPSLYPLERLAALYEAQQLKKEHAGN